MKIQDATLMAIADIIATPTTQIPTGFAGDLATNFALIKQYVLNGVTTSTRIPVSNGANSLTDFANFTYDGANTVLSIGSTASAQYGYIKLRRSTTSTPNDILGYVEILNNTNSVVQLKGFVANSGTGSVYQIGVSSSTSVTAQLNIDGTLNAMRFSGSDATNNAVTKMQRWTHSTTGTPAIGIGTGIEFETQTASTPTLKIGSTIESISTNITGGTEAFDLVFRNMSAGTLTERARLDSNGVLRLGTSAAGVVADASIMGLKSYSFTSDSSVFHINAYFQADQNIATTNSIQALEGLSVAAHPSGTVTLAIGTIGNIYLSSTGTLSTARSVQAGGNSVAAGTVTEWDLFYGNMANSGGAIYTTVVGLMIDTFPTATNKYGVIIADSLAKSGYGITSPTAIVDLAASTTSIASLRIRSGTAPTSPNDGDIWYDGTNIKIRVGGTTKTFTLI